MSPEIIQFSRKRATGMIAGAGIRISPEEAHAIEIVDFGLCNLESEGAQILTLFSTPRICAKVIALFPNQTEPEHWHPPVGADSGKEETIRIIDGIARFYLPGPDSMREGFIPAGKEGCYTCRRELVMRQCDTLTLQPGTKHWFQAGPSGAVMYSFSTCVRDGLDRFSDPAIVR